jgi:hypothetical protein
MLLMDANRVSQHTMQQPFNMSELSFNPDEKFEAVEPRAPGRCALGLTLLAIVRAAQALAGEQPTFAVGPVKPDFNPTRPTASLAPLLKPVPENFEASLENFQTIVTPETKTYSETEFRPRGRSVLEKEPADAAGDTSIIKGTTAWQRLDEYRAHNRVRVLTLWEDGGSSVSLQAGKRGDPSLQWTSRSMNRGGATRGLLDELFSVSLSSAGRGFKPAPRAQASDSSAKPSKPETAEVK